MVMRRKMVEDPVEAAGRRLDREFLAEFDAKRGRQRYFEALLDESFRGPPNRPRVDRDRRDQDMDSISDRRGVSRWG